MKKNTLATMLILCMLFALTGTALATETMTSDKNTEVIPVLGYVGPDTVVIDPDDPDPTAEIYVEVPTQVIFAAFESGSGIVTSPKYAIKNLSTESDIRVEIESFTQQNAETVPLDGKLTLKLVTYTNTDLVTGLYPAAYPPAQTLADRLPKQVDESEDNILGFMISGHWSGDFEAELQPNFDMTVKFSVIA